MEIMTLDVVVLPREDMTTFSITIFSLCSLGMVCSLAALGLVIFTAVVYEKWRKVYKNQLLLQFMLARFFYTFIRYGTEVNRFVNGTNFDLNSNYFEVISMTYTEVALVAWMFVFTKKMYDHFVRVFCGTVSLWKISAAAWVVPIPITIFLFFMCVFQGVDDKIFFMIYLLIAKWPFLLANGVLLALVLKTILSDNKSKKVKNRRIVVVMIMLIISFALQQIIWDAFKLVSSLSEEVFDTPSLIFLKLTNIFTVYQCAISILFWLFGNRSTRVMWGIDKEKIGIKKQPSISSVSEKISVRIKI